MASTDSSRNGIDGVLDPYEAYYRRERRRHRIEVAVVTGGLFVAVILVSAVFFFWYTEVDHRINSVNKENVALND